MELCADPDKKKFSACPYFGSFSSDQMWQISVQYSKRRRKIAAISDGSKKKFLTILIFTVLSISSKSGGKNGKHGWVPSVTVIAAASNVGVQPFQQVYRNQFRIFHESPGSPWIKRYALIQSSYFLCTLSNLPKLALGGTLQLSDPDYIFWEISISAIKVMKGRVSKKDNEDQNDD